jgi:hypothetical protein
VRDFMVARSSSDFFTTTTGHFDCRTETRLASPRNQFTLNAVHFRRDRGDRRRVSDRQGDGSARFSPPTADLTLGPG